MSHTPAKTLTADDLRALERELSAVAYALARHPAAMERGFTLSTVYGDLEISPDAPNFKAIIRDVKKSLETRYKRLEKQLNAGWAGRVQA